MTLRIVCCGRLKEAFFREALDEYIKRLSRYAKVEIIEVKDEKTPDRASKAEAALILEKEGGRLLSGIRDGDYVCALAIEGKEYSSEAFASHLAEIAGSGKSSVAFIIGGSLGLSPEVLRRADEKISFSKMTFPHQLMRVILAEQVYRSFRILKGEPYHK